MDLLTTLAAYGAAALTVLVPAVVMLVLWHGDHSRGSVLLEQLWRRTRDMCGA
jgi:hypothetical protein